MILMAGIKTQGHCNQPNQSKFSLQAYTKNSTTFSTISNNSRAPNGDSRAYKHAIFSFKRENGVLHYQVSGFGAQNLFLKGTTDYSR